MFVNELVKIPYLTHQWFCNDLDPNTADRSLDKQAVGIQLWGVLKKNRRM